MNATVHDPRVWTREGVMRIVEKAKLDPTSLTLTEIQALAFLVLMQAES